MGRHRSVSVAEQDLALGEDPAPAAQDFTSQSPNCLISNPIAATVWSILGSGRSPKEARRSFTVTVSIDQAAISLGMATLLGACIGIERQWRQRMAGLRTNTLVAIGAASFVIFEGLFPDDGSPTRVAAQVVSGIGFLGAGIIFREGLQVSGLNTAATLWCSAAVGLLAGSGHPLHAALATGSVVLVNLTLRPLVRLINRQPIAQAETDFHYRVRVVCRNPEEAHIRALLLQSTGNGHLSLRRLDSTDLEESGRVEVTAQLTSPSKTDAVLEQVVGRLSLEPTVSAASWSVGPMLE
jgi:putative Mg2+ transporter-C (MgtC) family protein